MIKNKLDIERLICLEHIILSYQGQLKYGAAAFP
jgi:23S rRNA maturation-related 3'-5' exoribonuclease YhaM